MAALPSSSDGEAAPPSPSYQQTWIEQQDLLKRKLVLVDDFCWALGDAEGGMGGGLLRYVGGVDVSFVKDDPSVACAALVVIDLQQQQQQQKRGRVAPPEVVHEAYEVVRLRVPYVPGFLAFREAPILLRLLEKMKHDALPFYPQLLMVDGNGILHPRGFGLACHLGVLADLPTIGVGKNLHHVDGLTLSRVRQLLEDPANATKDMVTLTGDSGQIWGAAMRSSPGSFNPIFISVGHRISLESCVKIVKMCRTYRVPEPIRQADIRSRQHLQNMQGVTLQCIYNRLDGVVLDLFGKWLVLQDGEAASCRYWEILRAIRREGEALQNG